MRMCQPLYPPSVPVSGLVMLKVSFQLLYCAVKSGQYTHGHRQTEVGGSSVGHILSLNLQAPALNGPHFPICTARGSRALCGPSLFWHIPGFAMSNFTNCSWVGEEKTLLLLPKPPESAEYLLVPLLSSSWELETAEARSRCLFYWFIYFYTKLNWKASLGAATCLFYNRISCYRILAAYIAKDDRALSCLPVSTCWGYRCYPIPSCSNCNIWLYSTFLLKRYTNLFSKINTLSGMGISVPCVPLFKFLFIFLFLLYYT